MILEFVHKKDTPHPVLEVRTKNNRSTLVVYRNISFSIWKDLDNFILNNLKDECTKIIVLWYSSNLDSESVRSVNIYQQSLESIRPVNVYSQCQSQEEQ